MSTKIKASDRELADLFDEWVDEIADDDAERALAMLEKLCSPDQGGRGYRSRVKGLGVVSAKALLVRLFVLVDDEVKKDE